MQAVPRMTNLPKEFLLKIVLSQIESQYHNTASDSSLCTTLRALQITLID